MSIEHWIKVRKGLNDSPKMVAVSRICGCTREKVFDAWFRLYCYFDSHTEDGHIPFLDEQEVDRIAGLKGCAGAMQSVGWLEFNGCGCVVVDYSKHNGNSAKKRLLHSESQNRYKSRKKDK
jgi:DNA replication protein DnaT